MGVLLPITHAICWPVSVRQISASGSFSIFISVKEVVFNGDFVEFYGVRVVSRMG